VIFGCRPGGGRVWSRALQELGLKSGARSPISSRKMVPGRRSRTILLPVLRGERLSHAEELGVEEGLLEPAQLTSTRDLARGSIMIMRATHPCPCRLAVRENVVRSL